MNNEYAIEKLTGALAHLEDNGTPRYEVIDVLGDLRLRTNPESNKNSFITSVAIRIVKSSGFEITGLGCDIQGYPYARLEKIE